MTTLTKYFENATVNVAKPVEFAKEMAIVKLIRSAESRFEALNEALNTSSDDKFYGQKGFRLVEMRDDSLISDRNHAALYGTITDLSNSVNQNKAAQDAVNTSVQTSIDVINNQLNGCTIEYIDGHFYVTHDKGGADPVSKKLDYAQ